MKLGRSIERLTGDLRKPAPVSSRELFENLDRITERIEDEMDGILFFFVQQDRVKYYETAEKLFGEEVIKSFPSTMVDIEEAGKCLAVGRGTACVFHLCRVLELGLRATAKRLGIPYAPSWESYLT